MQKQNLNGNMANITIIYEKFIKHVFYVFSEFKPTLLGDMYKEITQCWQLAVAFDADGSFLCWLFWCVIMFT